MKKPLWYELCLPQKEADGSFEHNVRFWGLISGDCSWKSDTPACFAINFDESKAGKREAQEQILCKAAKRMELDLVFKDGMCEITSEYRSRFCMYLSGRNCFNSYRYYGEDDFNMVTEAAKIYLDWCVKNHCMPCYTAVSAFFNRDTKYWKEGLNTQEYEWEEEGLMKKYYCIIPVDYLEARNLARDYLKIAKQIAEESRTKIYIKEHERGSRIMNYSRSVVIQANKKESVRQCIKNHFGYSVKDIPIEINQRVVEKERKAEQKNEQDWISSMVIKRYYYMTYINGSDMKRLSMERFKCANQIAKKSETKIVVGKRGKNQGRLLIQANEEEEIRRGVKEMEKFLEYELIDVEILLRPRHY